MVLNGYDNKYNANGIFNSPDAYDVLKFNGKYYHIMWESKMRKIFDIVIFNQMNFKKLKRAHMTNRWIRNYVKQYRFETFIFNNLKYIDQNKIQQYLISKL